MEKRYQVFVSSTYADLKSERSAVIRTLMEMDCIPAGMELFPAADEEQFQFITRVIDDCDYYLLIIGGRYGSTTPDGISYTEKEYDYAVDNGLTVVALLHEEPDTISVEKSDIDPVARERLQSFRDRVSANRLVRHWRTPDDLPGLVALSVQKAIKMYPAVGWVRADRVDNESLLAELNEVRKTNQKIAKSLATYKKAASVPPLNLASLDETVPLGGTYSDGRIKHDWSITIAWRDAFALIAPHLLSRPSDVRVETILSGALFARVKRSGHYVSLRDQDFQTVKIQLKAHDLVKLDYSQSLQGGAALFWSLTPKGTALMLDVRTVKSDQGEGPGNKHRTS